MGNQREMLRPKQRERGVLNLAGGGGDRITLMFH